LETRANPAQTWRFGVFEVDARNMEMRRGGTPVKIREQSFSILVFLLEHAGELVTREDLRRVLWPSDTFVDFDHSLNAAVMKLREALGGLPFFAEDLGHITPDVHALRERLQIPGMAVLQFAFGNDGAHLYLPHTYTADKVVYTGTHDNDTLLGWWESSATEHERRQVEAYVGRCEDGVNWAMIRAASSSVASLCLVPLQDALGLGKDARMNVPSRAEGNWGWRFDGGALRPELAKKLAELAEVSDRLPQPFAASSEPASSNPEHEAVSMRL